MNRRRLLLWLSVTALLPVAAEAQQAGKVWRIGLLRTRPIPQYDEAFRQGLRDLGYVDGRNIVLEYRWSNGDNERFPGLAAELVRIKADVIVAGGSAAIIAAKEATSTIPIVMALGSDPVRAGYVASLARPGGNITGISLLQEEFSGKWVELLKEALPKIRQVAVLGNPASPTTAGAMRDVQAAARKLGLAVHFAAAGGAKEYESAFAAMMRERVSALLVLADALFTADRQQIVRLAAKNRLPAIYQHGDFVEVGGLMSYGPNVPDLFRRAASHVDRILKGAKPAVIPVETPTKFELVLNLKTAKALDIKIPQTVLLRADRVIE